MKKLIFAAILISFASPAFADQVLRFVPIQGGACRVFDSRVVPVPYPSDFVQAENQRLPFNTVLEQQIAFEMIHCGVAIGGQTDARAVLVTFTVVNPDFAGNLKAWNADFPIPPTGVVMTFSAGVTISTTTVVPVSSASSGVNFLNGRIKYNAFSHTAGFYDLVIEVVGYYLE